MLRPPQPKTLFTSLQWSPLTNSRHLFAASTDGMVCTYSTTSGETVRRHRGARGVLNSVDCVRGTGRELLLAGGDDGVVRVWDVDAKDSLAEIDIGHPVTSAKWSIDGQQAFIGGLDNDIHCYDVRPAILIAICPSYAPLRCASKPSSTRFRVIIRPSPASLSAQTATSSSPPPSKSALSFFY